MFEKLKFGILGLVIGGALVSVVPLFVRDFNGKVFKGSSAPAQSASAPSANSSEELGSIMGQSVQRGQLSSSERMKIFEAESAFYNAIEEVMMQRYVTEFFENYRKEKNLKDLEEAQDKYFADKVKVSDADAQKILDENKDNPNLQRIPEDQRLAQVKNYLQGTAKRNVVRDFALEAKTQGKIKVSIARPTEPRLEVTDGGNYFAGPKNAKVSIVEFTDYQCPFCVKMLPTMAEIMKKYDGKVRWVIRDFPLREIHPEALPAAIVANCAGEQGKYMEMHNKLFENSRSLGQQTYQKLAQEIKLDVAKFDECRKNSAKQEVEVMKDYSDGIKIGVQGTPAFYINGRAIRGGADVATLSRMIDEELATN